MATARIRGHNRLGASRARCGIDPSHARLAVRAWLTVIAVFGSLLAVWPAPAVAAGRGASLSITIAGLASGERAAVLVRGPGRFLVRLAHARHLTGLRPGRYRVVVRPVTLAHAHGGVRPGARAFPDATALTIVSLKAGGNGRVTARYGTISNPGTRELADGSVRVVAGSAGDPRVIVMAASGRPRVGQLLLASTQRTLPRGLVARVIGVSVRRSRAILRLAPANLRDAFPELSINETVPLEPISALGAYARSDGHGPIAHASGGDFSFDLLAHLSCGSSSVAGTQLHFPMTLGSPTYSLTYDQPLVGLPRATATISYTPTIGVHAVFPAGAHCTVDTPTFGLGGKIGIPHTNIKVALSAGVKIEGGLTLNAPVTVDAGFSGSVTGGISDVLGRPATPVFGLSNVKGYGSMSSWTDWSLKVIPQLAAEARLGNYFDLHASVGPAMEYHSTPQAWWLEAFDELTAGLKLWQITADLPTLDSQPHLQPFYHARNASGGPSAGAAPPPPTAPQSPTSGTTFNEISRGTLKTYSSVRSGASGPDIHDGQMVAVACRYYDPGLNDANHDPWWYRIASSPWNGGYYAVAEGFYNNGTDNFNTAPWQQFDPNVPVC